MELHPSGHKVLKGEPPPALQIYGTDDGCTKRARQPDTIAHGPDGDVLILVRYGRVTMLGRLWDEERAERARSRSPCVQERGKPVPSESKG